jgi:hypothetical protein
MHDKHSITSTRCENLVNGWHLSRREEVSDERTTPTEEDHAYGRFRMLFSLCGCFISEYHKNGISYSTLRTMGENRFLVVKRSGNVVNG